MQKYTVNAVLVLCCVGSAYTQRVAPGVPPQQYQQYQQAQHPQHNVPVQHHQVPVQPQFQQPQQNFQQQQQQQQQFQHQQPHVNQPPPPPPQHQHQHQGQHAQSGHHNPQLLNPGNIAHEKEHIAEHLEVPIDTSKMSEQELQFHYFKMHDSDNNNMLDGCELIKSLIHWHVDEKEKAHPQAVQSDKDLSAVVDSALNLLDSNNDGLINYAEFKTGSETHQRV